MRLRADKSKMYGKVGNPAVLSLKASGVSERLGGLLSLFS